MARKNLLTLPGSEKQKLVDLMLKYITDQIIHNHHMINHFGAELFTGHRALLKEMETWLTQNDGNSFVPIPRWDPDTPIPQEFNVVKKTDGGKVNPPLENLTPNMSLPVGFQKPALCSFGTAELLGNGINAWHGSVHITIGGTMADASISPYAPIFWCYHAYLDDIFSEWQTCENPGENRNFDFINFDVLSDHSKMPSGKVTVNLFKEWINWSKENQPNLL